MNTLGERVKEALAEAGKSQTDLAKACGVKPSSVNGWLKGGSGSMKAIPAIRAAIFLKVNPLWLVEGTGPKKPGESATVYQVVFGSEDDPDQNIRAVVEMMREMDEGGRGFVRGVVWQARHGYQPAAKTPAAS